LTPYRIDIDAGESEARRDFLLGLIELILFLMWFVSVSVVERGLEPGGAATPTE
jgi:hypothetical protein